MQIGMHTDIAMQIGEHEYKKEDADWNANDSRGENRLRRRGQSHVIPTFAQIIRLQLACARIFPGTVQVGAEHCFCIVCFDYGPFQVEE